jgi:hypothetical protein
VGPFSLDRIHLLFEEVDWDSATPDKRPARLIAIPS